MLNFKNSLAFISACAFTVGFSGSAVAQPNQQFTIKSFNPDLCFDVANNQVFNGADIQVVKCKGVGHPAQTWINGDIIPDYPCGEGNCLYQLKLAANPNFCDYYEYSTKAPTEGVGLQLWQCQDSRNGNAAYWGFSLGHGYQAYKIYAGVPGVGVFTKKYASISVNAGEGERVRLRTEDENNFYRFWDTQSQ